MFARSARPVPDLTGPAVARQHLAAVFSASAASVVDAFAATEELDAFAVARMTDRWWTGVAADQANRTAVLERPVPVTLSVCHHLLVDDRAAHVADARRHAHPAVRALGRRHALGEYVSAPLRRPDGQLLGSLCGWSARAAVTPDPGAVLRRLETAADHLAARFAAALDAVADDRAAGRERALRGADPVTGLPDRRGWGQLLQDEEDRARQLAGPVSVVLVDVGTVRTARGLRRAADALQEAAGPAAVARVSGRRFGVLAGDVEDPVPLARAVRTALTGAGYGATTGWAVREPQEGLAGTWWRAEDALVQVRAALPG
jgi:GGDEF domain-containing protein